MFAVVATGRVWVPADAPLTLALPSVGLGESLLHKLVWCCFLHVLHQNFDEHCDTLWWPKQLKHKFSFLTRSIRAECSVTVVQECDGCGPLQKAQTGVLLAAWLFGLLLSPT